MIVVDTSAVVAIFRQESDAAGFAVAIGQAEEPTISAATVLEASLVLRGLKQLDPKKAEDWLNEFLDIAGMHIEPVTVEQAQVAREAHIRFGRGTGHTAQLNYGDCFSYALAKVMGAPLLFKGDDFARTDVLKAPCHVL
ncbi:PilT domain-containing protein [Gluconacetobacter sacchari DSM 12717]|uniref:Ribonuclease VapC n=2 Tax=Gluconacetobacter sacchari TaxID=92759 RepID=A0A7W4IEV1_9PROT|nr:type II toxin-antitoxin system VapC family toxin [Gluconacetobacter sacchari]MBB2161611.1 type II toxin-antitoxin system VapC family toxin [Gluconacetobacter sacchari]GBQ21430.1 PilT domain-containing protein [Gluconacetobacter sacchari DSM 12717]